LEINMAYRKTDHPGVSVCRNRHNKWCARWRDPDTRRVVEVSLAKLGYRTKTQAADWLRDKSLELLAARRRVAVSGRRKDVGATWKVVFDDYSKHFAGERGESAAERNEREWLTRFQRFLERHAIRIAGDLTSRHLSQFRHSLTTGRRKLAPRTRNRHLDAVKAMLRWAKRLGYLRLQTDDILDNLSRFQVATVQPVILKQSQLKALIAAVVEHDSARCHGSRQDKQAYYTGQPSVNPGPVFQPVAPYVFLLLLTGARPGEIEALKWEDVDLEGGQVLIWGSKTQRQRAVPLDDSPLLAAFLSALKLQSGGATHVCGDNREGGPLSFHNRRWLRVVKLAGLSGVPRKALRSTTVAHVASASPDSEYLLEARFGHGANVSKQHYRRPLHGLSKRGKTVEEWLGIEHDLRDAMTSLGYSGVLDANTA